PPALRPPRGERSPLPRRSDQTQAVTQPLDRGPGDEDAALERIGPLAPGSARRGGQQAILRKRFGLSSEGEEKGTGAIGVLRQAGLHTSLAEQRGLLVAGD